MDGGYTSIFNLKRLSDLNYDVYTGYNKRNSRKFDVDTDNELAEKVKKKYKKRIVVENLNAIVKRYPILINNYEKTTSSYNGLLLFTLTHILIKKIETLQKIRNDINFKLIK